MTEHAQKPKNCNTDLEKKNRCVVGYL